MAIAVFVSLSAAPASGYLAGSPLFSLGSSGGLQLKTFGGMPLAGSFAATGRSRGIRGRRAATPLMQRAPSHNQDHQQPDDTTEVDEFTKNLYRELRRRGATAAATNLSPLVSPIPTPSLSPCDVVKTVLGAMQHAHWPVRGNGAAVAQRFQWTGRRACESDSADGLPCVGGENLHEGGALEPLEMLEGGFDAFVVDQERMRFKLEDEGGKYAIIEAFVKRRGPNASPTPFQDGTFIQGIVKLHWRLRLDPEGGCWMTDRVHIDDEYTWLRDIVRPDVF